MSLFGNLFSKKFCNFCGSSISFFENSTISNGYCCSECQKKLSPSFGRLKTSNIGEIKYQLECREKNIEKLNSFRVTRTIGVQAKILIDEDKGQFIVNRGNAYASEKPDVIDFYNVTNCYMDIIESTKEIKYKDSTDEVKSFSPPSFASSYDFYIDISVNVPYIDILRFKLNQVAVNNGQSTLIKMESGGAFSKIVDAFVPAKSNPMGVSNAYMVRECAEYKKFERIGNEICQTLMAERQKKRVATEKEKQKIKCPWCGVKVIPDNDGCCNRCGGSLFV